MRITPSPEAYQRKPEEKAAFFRLVRAGFSQKRKQLASLLAAELGLEKQQIEEALIAQGQKTTARAQELSIEGWKKLTSIRV